MLYEPVTQLQPPLPPFAQLRDPSQLSLANSAVLFFAAVLCRASYAPTAAQFTQAAQAVFGPSATVTFVPNTSATVPGYGIVVTPSGGAVVVISGTTNLNQWLEQSLLSIPTYTNYGLTDSGEAADVYVTAANAIDTVLTTLCPVTHNVLITGHSMGGAVAQVLNYKQQFNGRNGNSEIITFAQPKAGDSTLAAGVNSGANSYARLIQQGDVVPALPPSTSLFAQAFLSGLIPTLRSALAYWNEFAPPNTAPLYLDSLGTLEYGSEPSLFAATVAAVINVNLGQPIGTVNAHLISTFANNLLQGVPSLTAMINQGWFNPTAIAQVNNALDNMGL